MATGPIGTVIGCALLAWIPLTIENKVFEELANACTKITSTAPDAHSCTTIKILVVIGISTLLGFSELTLPLFEQRIFGKFGLQMPTKRRKV
jgi:uncharacterized membrane protein YkvI